MKKGLLPYLILGIIVLVVILFFFATSRNKKEEQVTTLPDAQLDGFCAPTDLEATISFEGAAGSTYAALAIKNTGGTSCFVDGDNYVDVRYDIRTVQNVTLEKKDEPKESQYQLEPGQTLYSQIKYPNGAQCGSQTKTINVLYAYRISSSGEIIFKGEDSQTPTTLTICTSNKKTNIEIWPLSKEPITP